MNSTPAAAGSVTFVGNATTILRFGDFTVLTDPNFLYAGQRAYLAEPRVEPGPPGAAGDIGARPARAWRNLYTAFRSPLRDFLRAVEPLGVGGTVRPIDRGDTLTVPAGVASRP